MIGLIFLLFCLIALIAIIVEGPFKDWRNDPRRQAVRHFKKVKKSILREMGPDLKKEASSMMELCEKELRKLLRAKDSIKDLKALSKAMSYEVSVTSLHRSNPFQDEPYDKEEELVEERIANFLEQMLYIHRLAVTQEREAILELQGMTQDFEDSMEARREVLEGMTFGRFDEELEMSMSQIKSKS